MRAKKSQQPVAPSLLKLDCTHVTAARVLYREESNFRIERRERGKITDFSGNQEAYCEREALSLGDIRPSHASRKYKKTTFIFPIYISHAV